MDKHKCNKITIKCFKKQTNIWYKPFGDIWLNWRLWVINIQFHLVIKMAIYCLKQGINSELFHFGYNNLLFLYVNYGKNALLFCALFPIMCSMKGWAIRAHMESTWSAFSFFLLCCMSELGIYVIQNKVQAVLQIVSVALWWVYHTICSIMLHFCACPRDFTLFFNPQNQYIMHIVAFHSYTVPLNNSMQHLCRQVNVQNCLWKWWAGIKIFFLNFFAYFTPQHEIRKRCLYWRVQKPY